NADAFLRSGLGSETDHRAGVGVRRDAVTARQDAVRAERVEPLSAVGQRSSRAGESFRERAVETVGCTPGCQRVGAAYEPSGGRAVEAAAAIPQPFLAAGDLRDRRQPREVA